MSGGLKRITIRLVGYVKVNLARRSANNSRWFFPFTLTVHTALYSFRVSVSPETLRIWTCVPSHTDFY